MKGREISLAVDDVEAPPAGYADVLRRAESLRRRRNRWVAVGPVAVVAAVVVALTFIPTSRAGKTAGPAHLTAYGRCLATKGTHLADPVRAPISLAIGESVVVTADGLTVPAADSERFIKVTSSGINRDGSVCAAFMAVAPGTAVVHAVNRGACGDPDVGIPCGLPAHGMTIDITVLAAGAHTAPAMLCSQADLDAPTTSAMPTPETVTARVTLRPSPDLTTLSAPTKPSTITAEQAWAAARKGKPPYSTVGTELLLYGSLYTAYPATTQPDGSTKPNYDHVDVWVIWGQHMPYEFDKGASPGLQPPAAASPRAEPVCGFSSGFTIVYANTGHVGFSASSG